MLRHNLTVLFFGAVFLYSTPAIAYIGLGPGLTFIGSFFTLIIGVLIALLMIVVLPMRMMMKKRRAKKQVEESAGKTEASGDK
jgi:uncharacterized membrane protein YgaE (UPF0421/DUF939 family)